MENKNVVRAFRLLDPELTKNGEFFTIRRSRSDRNTARGGSILVVCAQSTEKARTFNAHHFVELTRPVQGRQKTESCKSQN